MNQPEILYEVSQRIATITLNRPDRLNAYTASLGDALRTAVRRAADDAGVRVIVLTGAGRGFCAGADMANLSQGTARGFHRTLNPMNRPTPAMPTARRTQATR